MNNAHLSKVLTFILPVLLSLCPMALKAQQSRILEDGILTLRTEVEGTLVSFPVLQLDTDEVMEVSFDEMSHEYHRFVYRLEHCDRLWRKTQDLFYSEYAESTQTDVPIENYTESQNVLTHYTHYAFEFPNEDMRPLVSGNYRLTILNDDGDAPFPVAEVYFAMLESRVSISASVTTDTDYDYNGAYQQIAMTIDTGSLPNRDLNADIHTVVLQNDRIDNAVVDANASYLNGSKLIWDHQRELAFPAGNEYRKYELLSERYPGMHVESVHYHEPFLHATIDADVVRRHYITQEDQNGTSVIRNTDNQDDATETEYMITHFSLACPEPFDDAEVYLNGRWTSGGVCPEWQLHYSETDHAYLGAFMMKQGYYDYQYLVVPTENRLKRSPLRMPQGMTAQTEGNFYQTSNDYRILVYFSQPGARYERLVGMKTLTYN